MIIFILVDKNFEDSANKFNGKINHTKKIVTKSTGKKTHSKTFIWAKNQAYKGHKCEEEIFKLTRI